MKQLFGGDAFEISLCPGETNCDRFQSANGRSRTEKARNACTGCSLLPTKLDSAKRQHESLKRVVSEAMLIRAERLAGYPRDRNHIRSISFHALLLVERMIEAEKITQSARLTAILKAGLGVKQA